MRLQPGPKRIDELADFLELLANATPQNEQAIRDEIKRYFSDVGWQFAGDELNRKLTDVLKPGITKEMRQEFLNRIQTFALADPSEVARNQGIATNLVVAAAAITSAAQAWRSGWAAVVAISRNDLVVRSIEIFALSIRFPKASPPA